MIYVLLAVQHRILRDCLTHILNGRNEIEVVGAVGHASLALAMAEDLKPEVVVVDMLMTGGDELVTSIATANEKTRSVALGTCSESTVSALPDASLPELIAAIHAAARSRVIKLSNRFDALHQPGGEHSLTAREREIVKLIDRGFSNKEIARDLNMAVSTVKNHVHHILKKLAVARRGQAAAVVRGD